jgi:hypothetical protein
MRHTIVHGSYCAAGSGIAIPFYGKALPVLARACSVRALRLPDQAGLQRLSSSIQLAFILHSSYWLSITLESAMTSINGLALNNAVGQNIKSYRLDNSALASSAEPVAKSPGLAEVEGKPKSASDSFMEYMAMSDQEKLQYMILAQMGISKEEYDAMSPEEKGKIDALVEERMKQIAQTQNMQQERSQSGNAEKLNAAIDSTRASDRKSILDLSA